MKVQSVGKQVINSVILSVILIGLTLGLQQIPGSEGFLHSGILAIVIFSGFLGMLISFMVGWGLENLDAGNRPNLFIAITGIRMIISLIFVLIVLYNGLDNQMVWVVNFFAVYLVYLVFEIKVIMSNLRAISNEGEQK